MAVIHYSVGDERRVILESGESLVESEYNEIRAKDERIGYADRMVGVYDKWYRYHRSDDGAAYDKGVQRATRENNCPADCEIIEGR